jgi:hypothetical protein
LFFVPNSLAWQFFEVVRFRQQISRHFFKAFGQAPVIAILCQARAHLRLTPKICRESRPSAAQELLS